MQSNTFGRGLNTVNAHQIDVLKDPEGINYERCFIDFFEFTHQLCFHLMEKWLLYR